MGRENMKESFHEPNSCIRSSFAVFATVAVFAVVGGDSDIGN